MNKHKWAKEIKAWADGAEIEVKDGKSDWWTTPDPNWSLHPSVEYRIKPQPKEPQYLYVWMDKDTGNPAFELEKPNHILEDEVHKYMGKIKLEVDDE